MTAAELLVRIQAAGTDELKKVATAVESVGTGTRLAGAQLKTFDSTLNSLVGSGKTYTDALKEMANSQGVLSSSVVATSTALLKQMGIVIKTKDETQKLVGANIAAGAAIRDFTGQSNVRAIENLLSNVLGLGAAFQSMFVITGLVAVGEELYKVYEHFNPLIQATKDLAKENKTLDQTYKDVTARIETFIERQARATLGPSAARAVAAFDAETQRREAQAGLDEIGQQISGKQKKLYVTTPATHKSGAFGSHGESVDTPATTEIDRVVEKQIQTLEAKAEGYRLLIREFDEKKKADDDEAAKDKSREDKEAGRPAAELKKRQDEELLKIRKELEALTAKELTGEDKIRATRAAIIEQLQAEHLLRTEGLAIENQITEELVKQFQTKMGADAVVLQGAFGKSQLKSRERMRRAGIAELGRDAAYDNSADERDAAGQRRVQQGADDAEDTRIRRVAAQAPMRGKRRPEDDPAAAELRSYQAELAAAEAIYQNDVKRLDVAKLDADLAKNTADLKYHLSADEWADEIKLSDARKKNEEDQYQLQERHRNALAEEQRADLQKYETLADQIFGALTNRKRGAAYELGQMAKSGALGQARQVFSNATAPTLQALGHAVGGLSHGHFQDILKGTIFDSKNADPATRAQQDTAKNTKDTADGVRAVAAILSGRPGGTAAAGPASAAQGIKNYLHGFGGLLHLNTGATGDSSDWMPGNASYDPYAGLPVSAPGSTANGGNYDSAVGLPSGLSGASKFSTAASGALGVASGALEIASGVKQGGAGGALKIAGGAASAAGSAISAVAKLAGAVAPALSAAGPIGMAIGAGLSLIGGFFQSGPEQYAKKVATELQTNQYLAPTALNVTQSTNGTYADFDSRGNLRTSNLRAVPTVAEAYTTARRIDGVLEYANVPGYVQKPFSGPQTPTTVTVHVNAIDSQSGVDFLMRNHQAVGESLATHLQVHDGSASNEIRNLTR